MLEPGPKVVVFRRQFDAFHFFGIVGSIFAIVSVFWAGRQVGITNGMLLVGCLSAFLSAYFLFYFQYILLGKRELVFYRHALFIVFINLAFALRLDTNHWLTWLDLTILGLGVFQGFGRIGCFNAGCCHGCPCRVGVIYNERFIPTNFPKYFINLKVFPIQLIESVLIFLIILADVNFLLNKYPAGTALVFHALSYGSIRFILEFYRGDIERPFFKGFSEAQWTSFGIFILIAILYKYRFFPSNHWFTLTANTGILVYLSLWISEQRKSRALLRKINHPRHVKDLVLKLKPIQNPEDKTSLSVPRPSISIPVVSTYLGIHLSHGQYSVESKTIHYYTLSVADKHPDESAYPTAKSVGKLIQKIFYQKENLLVKESKIGIYHLFFYRVNDIVS